MAAMTTAQQNALGGMNLSSNEEKLEELKAIEAKIKAEQAKIKADMAAEKAAEANAQADARLMYEASGIEDRAEMDIRAVEETAEKRDDSHLTDPDWIDEQNRLSDEKLMVQARGLTGDRDAEGSLITTKQRAEPETPFAPDKGIEVSEDREDFKEAAKRQQSEKGIQDDEFAAEIKEHYKKYGVTGDDDAEKKLGMTQKYLDYLTEKTAIVDKYTAESTILAENQDIDEDDFTDVESKPRDVESNVEQDRAQTSYPSDDETGRGEKAGWTMAEGSNMWSVDEKDDYWKTQEGYDEAVSLYGKKPAWVKEPTLVWNAETGEYEEVEEEEFEDLSQPAISADIKKLFG